MPRSIVRETTSGGNGLRFTFGSNLNAFSNPTHVYFGDDGRVGIGTGAPATDLTVVGNSNVTGTMDIVMNPGSLVTNAQGKAFVASWEGGDHVTTETIAGYLGRDAGTMQMQRLYAAWFRCFLADDTTACKLFEGGTPDGCGMCKDKGWNLLASKNM